MTTVTSAATIDSPFFDDDACATYLREHPEIVEAAPDWATMIRVGTAWANPGESDVQYSREYDDGAEMSTVAAYVQGEPLRFEDAIAVDLPGNDIPMDAALETVRDIRARAGGAVLEVGAGIYAHEAFDLMGKLRKVVEAEGFEGVGEPPFWRDVVELKSTRRRILVEELRS